VNPVLELRDVSAAYGPFRALVEVSLAVGPGEAVALVGPNGAGKTTVARVASGLVAPTPRRRGRRDVTRSSARRRPSET
jgi:branched-chain amino acid transport system ATP-binding protein